jgi:hypothetical protein
VVIDLKGRMEALVPVTLSTKMAVILLAFIFVQLDHLILNYPIESLG